MYGKIKRLYLYGMGFVILGAYLKGLANIGLDSDNFFCRTTRLNNTDQKLETSSFVFFFQVQNFLKTFCELAC